MDISKSYWPSSWPAWWSPAVRCVSRVAEDIQQQGSRLAKMSSIEGRLERFLANEQVEVDAVWETFLGQVLPYWKGQKLTFVLDCTP
jgi:hypothetical protein